ncbi:hypothetical protein ACJJTC_018839 [Scirpophaga incertulas]
MPINTGSNTSSVSSMPSCSKQNNDEDSIGELEPEFDDDFVIQMLRSRPPFPDFDLHTFLTTSPSGNSILAYYKAHKSLSPKHRNIVTDIIITRIFTHLVNY